MSTFETFKSNSIKKIFDQYPTVIKKKLLLIRQIIYDVAVETPGVGELEETLKWGEPSYLTSQTKSGTTIRIDWKPSAPHQYAIYFNCRTTLVDSFKNIYGDLFNYGGNRSIVFTEHDHIPIDELSHCIAMALTYHLNKKESQI